MVIAVLALVAPAAIVSAASPSVQPSVSTAVDAGSAAIVIARAVVALVPASRVTVSVIVVSTSCSTDWG